MDTRPFKILVLATNSGGYAGANSVGQSHLDYASNTYILPVVCPAEFAEEFYLSAFRKGIDAIIVMYSGTDCPYKDGDTRTAKIINRTYPLMKERGIDTRRLRLSAICTVCVNPFLKEIKLANELLSEIGSIYQESQVESLSEG